MRNLLDKKNKHSFSGYNAEDVKKKLSTIYHDKCAYCESKRHNAKMQVEHYRPKKEVTGNSHTGYYWLAYEWTNLLLSCPDCNDQAAKGNHFPIAKNRQLFTENKNDWNANTNILLSEEPYLLHPEIDIPEDHLIYNFAAKLIEKDNSKRGQKTIEICKLNRDTLWKSVRKGKLECLLKRIKKRVVKYEELKKDFLDRFKITGFKEWIYEFSFWNEFDEINKKQNKDEEFSLLFIALYNNFNNFIDNNIVFKKIDKSQIIVIKEAFKLYKQKNI